MPLNWENRSPATNTHISLRQCDECHEWMTVRAKHSLIILQEMYYHDACKEIVEARQLMTAMDYAVNGGPEWDDDDWR